MKKQSLLSRTPFQAILVGLILILLFGLVGHFDQENEQFEEDRYCEMVALWNKDKAAGIPANQRNGWPPFRKGEVSCPR